MIVWLLDDVVKECEIEESNKMTDPCKWLHLPKKHSFPCSICGGTAEEKMEFVRRLAKSKYPPSQSIEKEINEV